METPSSTRRITRSQMKSAMNNNIPISKKTEESEMGHSRQRKANALVDITNDSPIVGLAMGSLETPSSLLKKRDLPKQTPGSGEALLRGQVKTLLQKVEEEAELSKISFDRRPSFQVQGGVLVNSPSGLLAPTPTNTPQVPNLSCNGDLVINVDGFASEMPSDSETKQVAMVIDGSKQETTLETEKSLNRSLLLDFFEKSEISDASSCSSVLTYQEGSSATVEKSNEEDDASLWSIQVNTSIRDEDDEEEEIEVEVLEEEEEDDYDYEEAEEGEEEGGLLDELCQGLSKICVEEKKKLPEFEGKHTRFVYNSDDEIEGEVEVGAVSPSALRLKGLPVPQGKHLRFPEDED